MKYTPLIVVSIGLLIGIIWELYLQISIVLFCMFYLIIICLFNKTIFRYDRCIFPNYLKIIFIISVLAGNILYNYNNYKIKDIFINLNNKEVFVQGIIVSNVEEKEYSDNYLIKLTILNNQKKYNNTYLLLKLKKSKVKFEYGDFIQLKDIYMIADQASNYKGFDYQKYLLSKKVSGIIESSANNIKILENRKLNVIRININQFQLKLYKNIDNILKDDSKALFCSILFGDKSQLDEDIKDSFTNCNLSHMLAVSGMHVSYIVLTITILLKNKINSRYEKVICIIILLIYMQMASYALSVVRAVIMSSFILLEEVFYRKSNIYNNLSISLIIILCWNPFAIYNLGFILSYLGTLGIFLFYKPIDIISKKSMKKIFKIKNEYINKFIESIRGLICVTLSANIVLFPILLYYFNSLPINFIISNILASPILILIVFVGIVVIIVSLFSINIACLIGCILDILLKILILIVNTLDNIKNIKVVSFSFVFIILYYLCALFLRYIWKIKNKERRYQYENKILNNYKSIKIYLKYNYKKILSLLIIIVILLNIFLNIVISKDLKIFIVDVGQGDCSLIVTPSNKRILIDAGGSESSNYDVGKKIVVPYLLKRKIIRIDYLIISHFDNDHVDGTFAVIEELKVKNIVIGLQNEENSNYIKLMQKVKDKNIRLIIVEAGNKINIDKNVNMDIIWPIRENLINDNGVNNNSIVAKLSYNEFSMLYTGDIEKIAEKEILKYYGKNDILKSNILKVAHHGSKTSSIDEFIKLVKPKIAIISVGKNNKFGHPNESTLINLKENNAMIYRTDMQGEIDIFINNKNEIDIKQ